MRGTGVGGRGDWEGRGVRGREVGGGVGWEGERCGRGRGVGGERVGGGRGWDGSWCVGGVPLQTIQQGGNDKAKAIYEANLPSDYKRPMDD